MADVSIKSEIKAEAGTAEEDKALADADDYEDDPDLTFPDELTQAWLVKVPQDLWRAWHQLYADAPEDTPVEIGKMRVYNAPPDADPLKQHIEIRLDAGVAEHEDMPHRYIVNLTTNGYNNTVVFSEKDRAGHRGQPFARRSRANAKPAGIPAKTERYGNRTGYRTAIPKHTALAPMIHHEANAAPIEDEAYLAHLAKRWQQDARPRNAVQFTEGIDRGMHPGAATRTPVFTTSSKPASKGGRPKKIVKEKAVRMEKGALIDALMQCFRRYKYWGMKALRAELKQPETYIKETLEEFAVLVRSGDFNMHWQLKPGSEYLLEQHGGDDAGPVAVKDEVAKVESGSDIGTGDEMDDDDDEEFEDVTMDGS